MIVYAFGDFLDNSLQFVVAPFLLSAYFRAQIQNMYLLQFIIGTAFQGLLFHFYDPKPHQPYFAMPRHALPKCTCSNIYLDSVHVMHMNVVNIEVIFCVMIKCKGSSIIFIIYAYDNFYHNSLNPSPYDSNHHFSLEYRNGVHSYSNSKCQRFDHLINLGSLTCIFD